MMHHDAWHFCRKSSRDLAAIAGRVRSSHTRPVTKLVQAWEGLPNGAWVARVGMRHRLVVRRGGRGRFRFAVLEVLPGSGALAHIAHGYCRDSGWAMAVAERALAAVLAHGRDAFARRPADGSAVQRG